jgi:hypothetical protein
MILATALAPRPAIITYERDAAQASTSNFNDKAVNTTIESELTH